MIDTHCHLFNQDYEELDKLLFELDNLSIKCIINGTSKEDNLEALNLALTHKNIYAAIGFHPSCVDSIENDYIEFLESNILNAVAIGEIGLDYYWTKDNMEKQKEIFENQLRIAEKYNKPVIIHTRDAINDTYNILKKYKVKGVIHAFSGSLEMAKKFIDLGYKLGVGGVITFKNCNLKDVISNIDITDIVLETDSPYLSPEPVRGKRNTPLNLKYIAEFIADLKNISYDEVCNITTNTATSLFDL